MSRLLIWAVVVVLTSTATLGQVDVWADGIVLERVGSQWAVEGRIGVGTDLAQMPYKANVSLTQVRDGAVIATIWSRMFSLQASGGSTSCNPGCLSQSCTGRCLLDDAVGDCAVFVANCKTIDGHNECGCIGKGGSGFIGIRPGDQLQLSINAETGIEDVNPANNTSTFVVN